MSKYDYTEEQVATINEVLAPFGVTAKSNFLVGVDLNGGIADSYSRENKRRYCILTHSSTGFCMNNTSSHWGLSDTKQIAEDTNEVYAAMVALDKAGIPVSE